ncbi:MAG: hypothetical protein ACREBW_04590, partial [Candidatus Micrarchaeaceae archaeon]
RRAEPATVPASGQHRRCQPGVEQRDNLVRPDRRRPAAVGHDQSVTASTESPGSGRSRLAWRCLRQRAEA